MGKLVDLSGQKHSRWTVLSRVPRVGRHEVVKWRCQCECGAVKEVEGRTLLNGLSKSCGCYKAEAMSDRATTHGLHKSVEYTTWGNMVARCTNPNHPNYANYGGRGITVCPEWLTFEGFFADMGKRPEGKTLDREKNEMGYSKANCRWATTLEQGNNTRTNVFHTINGVTKTQADWARHFGISPTTLSYRLRTWDDPVRACTEPVHRS